MSHTSENMSGGSDTVAGPLYASSSTVWYTIGVLTFGFILAYLDRNVMSILIEPMRRDLGLSDTELGLIQGFAFSIFFVLAGVPIGRLADRLNRRNILMIGIVCWSAATFVCGLADNFWELFFARVMVGVGEACLAPTAYSIVSDLVPPKRRGFAMGVLTGGSAIGAAGALFVGGLILQSFPIGLQVAGLGHVAAWQLVFFLVSLPGAALVLFLLTTKEPVRQEYAVSDDLSANSFVSFLRANKAGVGFAYAAFASNLVCGVAAVVWIPVVMMRVYEVPAAELGATIGLLMLVVGAISMPVGGVLADWMHLKVPSIGRMGVPLIVFPVLIVLSATWHFFDTAAATVIYYGVSVCFFGSLINAASFSTLNQMVPNNMRGQIVTIFMVVGNFAGLGLSSTLVGVASDYIFKDPMMVKTSLIAVAIPAQALGFIFALLALKPYRRACEHSERLMAGR